MSSKKMLNFKKLYKILAISLISVLGALAFASVFAGGPSGIALSKISSHVDDSVKYLSIVLGDIALVAGIGFVMASFFKFHQHKLNPTQVPISQGVTLLLIGAGLMLFPTMMGTAKKAVFGSATISTIGGSQISGIIGKSG